MTHPRRFALASFIACLCPAIPSPAAGQSSAIRILTAGAPSTYQIVSIPIPDGVTRIGEGRVEIVAREGFTILGTRAWSLRSLIGKTNVTSIIGIPASALAGRFAGAEVRFSVAGAPIETVPIEIDVTLVRGLAVRLQSAVRARPGSRVILSYDVVNTGNGMESFQTLVSTPSGWKAEPREGAVMSVKPGESVTRQVVVSIPREIGTGSFFLRLDMSSGGELRSSLPVAVEVLAGLSLHATPGPEITVAVARATGPSGHGSMITTTGVRGPLFDAVRIDASYSVGATPSGSHSQALSKLGSYREAPSLVLSSPAGRLAFGAVGTSFSDLSGLDAYGSGAVLDARGSAWHVLGLAGSSNLTSVAGQSQPIVGVRGDADLGPFRIMSSVAHLRGGEQSGRRLDAVGVGASLSTGFAMTIQGEVARRQFTGGSGTGWSTAIARSDSSGTASVRVTRAPGGSETYARAANEVVANISRAVSERIGLSASGWRLSDSTTAFARLLSNGWAIHPEYRVHSSTTVAIEARSSEITAVTAGSQPGAATGYGGAERQLGIRVSTNVRALYVSASAAGGSVERTIETTSAASRDVRSPKVWWNAAASWRGARTLVDLQGNLEEMRDVSGAVSRPSRISLRAKHSLWSALSRSASADWEVQQIRGFSTRPVTVLSAGMSVPITEMVALKLDAERNPLFVATAGSSPWVLAFRVEHVMRLPMMRAPGSSGYVYRDLNGNQRRDAGEPGVRGALLTRGAEIAITDANGKYRLLGPAGLSISLDESSLPLGWIRQTPTSPDIAVGSNLNAEIRFLVAPRSAIDAVEVDLSGIRVIARDASGREWVARMIAPGVASFDALPLGTYTLAFDLSAVSEPLVPRAPLPLLRVTSLERSIVTVLLDPRPLRMWRAAPIPEPPP